MKLIDIFESYPDEDELIWQFIGELDFENEDFPVQIDDINKYATPQFIKNFNKRALPWQKALVDDKKEDIDSIKDIPVIVHEDIIVDGNHRLMALYLANAQLIKIIKL